MPTLFRRRLNTFAWLFPAVWLFACAGGTTARPPAETPKPTEPELVLRKAPPKYEVTDRVAIKTSAGVMVIGLYGKDAPKTVQNFLKYVDSGFYENKIFHRVIAGFMIQGGGFDADLKRAEIGEPIRLEIVPGLEHEPGIISMARMPDDINSATSQFFICATNARQLNGAYAAFGKLEEGEEVLYAISGTPTHSVETSYGSMNDVPIQPVVIESITRL
jgi:peptidyl-prolyl cis-trans isomerase B (cyclophilin B)